MLLGIRKLVIKMHSVQMDMDRRIKRLEQMAYENAQEEFKVADKLEDLAEHMRTKAKKEIASLRNPEAGNERRVLTIEEIINKTI